MSLKVSQPQLMSWYYTYHLHFLILSVIFITISACSNRELSAPKFEELPELPEKQMMSQKAEANERNPLSFVISLTGEVRGEIEPCGCPTLPYGGFQRREAYLNELRQKHTVFHLDVGEMLLKGFSTNSRNDKDERASLILSLIDTVGLDVWNIGPSDLSILSPPFEQYTVAVSASFTDQSDKPLFPPSKIVSKDGIRIGVIGISTPPTDPSFQYSYRAPKDALEIGIESLKPHDVDLVVVLSSVSDDQLDRLIQESPVGAVVLSTIGSLLDEPRHPDGNPALPLVVETPDRGRYVQNIYVRLTRNETHPLETLDDEQLWRNQLFSPNTDNLSEIGTGKNLAYAELVPLNKRFDSHNAPQSGVAIDDFKEQIRQKAAQVAQQEPEPSEPGYATAAACTRCHTQEFARWTFSQHPRAWESLIREGQADNPECIGCHSTAYGEPGGFGELTQSNILRFKGVQCEACHGPLKGHPNADDIHPLPITPDRCLGCHDEANSPNFEFESYLHRASCQAVTTIEEP